MQDVMPGPMASTLLEAATRNGLYVANDEIMYETPMGGGLVATTWLTQRDGGLRLELHVLEEKRHAGETRAALMPGARTEAIGEDQALAIIEHWGFLRRQAWAFAASCGGTLATA